MSEQSRRQQRAMELMHIVCDNVRSAAEVAAEFTEEEIKEAKVVATEGCYPVASFALDALFMAKRSLRPWTYTEDSLPKPLQECDISYIPVPGDDPANDVGYLQKDGDWCFTGGQVMGTTPFAWRLRDDPPAQVRA